MTKTGMMLCLLAMSLFASSAAAAPGKKKEDPAASFFGPDKVYAIHLHLTDEDWQLMHPARRPRPAPLIAETIPAPTATRHAETAPPSAPHEQKSPAVNGQRLPPNNFGFEYVFVKADFECDGQKLANVAIRFKGNSSYENYQRSLKCPLKIDFNRFAPGQKFHGLDTINLSNNAFDPSQLREALSYEVYRRCGVPAPRTAFAALYLTVDGRYDHELAGLYTIIEEMDDKPFLKEHFDTSAGLIVKPEGVRGLPYMGENWRAYAQRYHPKTSEHNPEIAQRFIDFIKLVNYADDAAFNARIGEYLHVENFLRYLAATTLICNLDSPLVTNHNFYLYENPVDKKIWLLPWDMNLSFGGYGTPGPRDSQIDLSIARPWAGENKLFSRVMAIRQNQEAYRKILRQSIRDFYNAKTMQALIETMQTAINRADKAVHRPSSLDQERSNGFGYARLTLEQFIPRRVDSVIAQLDGKSVNEFFPRSNPSNMVFRWGINAPYEMGNLPTMAQAIRKSADIDGDYFLSGRELRDAAAALYYNLADEDDPDFISQDRLAAGLDELLRPFAINTGGRGFFGLNRSSNIGALWAQAIFREADTNKDNKLTLDEITDLVTRLACLTDENNDDQLDEREVIEALDGLAVPNRPTPSNEDNILPRRFRPQQVQRRNNSRLIK